MVREFGGIASLFIVGRSIWVAHQSCAVEFDTIGIFYTQIDDAPVLHCAYRRTKCCYTTLFHFTIINIGGQAGIEVLKLIDRGEASVFREIQRIHTQWFLHKETLEGMQNIVVVDRAVSNVTFRPS